MIYQPSLDQGENRASNFYAPGARDLLPVDVAQQQWVEKNLQDVFHRWGYHRIITSTLEPLDTLMAGGAIDGNMVIPVNSLEGPNLGLRPELTASIARASVTRMGAQYPQRLYYHANVFRRSIAGHGSQQEFYQAGVELLGAGGISADAEILLLIADCVEQLGLSNWQLLLGEADLTNALLGQFPADLQPQIRYCLANLDRVTLENLSLSPELKTLALSLLDLRGEPLTVLSLLANLPLDPHCVEIIHNLQSLFTLLKDTSSHPLPFTLDLSLIRTYGYYTGIVFELVSNHDGVLSVLAQGGRYDRLLGLYHPQRIDYPGIGFSLNIETLQQVLRQHPHLPQTAPKTDWLVVGDSTAAFRYAQTLRNSAHLVRVEVYLGDETPEVIRQTAKERGIGSIAWVRDDQSPEIESL